jgi:hypothetical protein
MTTQIIEGTGRKNADSFGTALNSAMVDVGDKFGLYQAISETGPATPVELAARTGASERHISLWLAAQAAEDFVDHDAATGRYSLWCSWPRTQ